MGFKEQFQQLIADTKELENKVDELKAELDKEQTQEKVEELETLERLYEENKSIAEKKLDKLGLPDINVVWLRFQEYISFNRPSTFLALGMRGAGKSCLLEAIAIRYTKIIDLFGSSDNEGLCWCKTEFIEIFKKSYGREPKILLVKSAAVQVVSQRNFETLDIDDITLEHFERNDVITTVHAFYRDEEEYFDALFRIVKMLWGKIFWIEPWIVLIREAANWIYSRLKVVKNDSAAKAEFIKALREARHSGLAIAVDTLRWTNLDKEIRDLADYVFVKRVGAVGLPDDLRWLYRYVKPFSLMQTKAQYFLLSTSHGAVGIGMFDYPEWHKKEKEHIFRSTGIEFSADPDAPPRIDTYQVGILEHSMIINKYLEVRSCQKVADEFHRGKGTVGKHIGDHNSEVEKNGICIRCKESKSEFAEDYIVTKRGGQKKSKR